MVSFAIIAVFGLMVFALSCCAFSIVNKQFKPKKKPDQKYSHHLLYLSNTEGGNMKKGFTLIELTISMFLLCFGLLAMGSFIGVMTKTTIQGKQITVASTLIQDKFESIKNTGFVINAGTDTGNISGLVYSRDWVVNPNGNNMKQIDITVTIGSKQFVARSIIAE